MFFWLRTSRFDLYPQGASFKTVTSLGLLSRFFQFYNVIHIITCTLLGIKNKIKNHVCCFKTTGQTANQSPALRLEEWSNSAAAEPNLAFFFSWNIQTKRPAQSSPHVKKRRSGPPSTWRKRPKLMLYCFPVEASTPSQRDTFICSVSNFCSSVSPHPNLILWCLKIFLYFFLFGTPRHLVISDLALGSLSKSWCWNGRRLLTRQITST